MHLPGSLSFLGEFSGDSVTDSSVVTPSTRDSRTGEISSLVEKEGEEVEGEEVEGEVVEGEEGRGGRSKEEIKRYLLYYYIIHLKATTQK